MQRPRVLLVAVAALALAGALAGCAGQTLSVPLATLPSPVTASAVTTPPLVFAVIGDYGMNNANEAAVARLVASWKPEFVVTTGDDYYRDAGGTGLDKYKRSTGAYYGTWVSRHRFFPSMGNHDYTDATPAPETYLSYFELPGTGYRSFSGNERYYDVVMGPVHLFVVNSNPQEPAGITRTSKQARWLRTALHASRSQFNLVVDHHPPYSSDRDHGSTPALQWPYAQWGADAVLSGHAHVYERIQRDGTTYVVNGLGGATRKSFATPVSGSVKRYNANWGALKVTVEGDSLRCEFRSIDGKLVDSFRVTPTSSGTSSARTP